MTTHLINEEQLQQITKNIQAIVNVELAKESVYFGLFLKIHMTSIELCSVNQFKDLYNLFKEEQKKWFKDGKGNYWIFYSEPKKRGEYRYWIAECLDMNIAHKGNTKKEVKDWVLFTYGQQENK